MLLAGCSHQATYAGGCGTMPSNWITPRHGRSVLSLLSVISVASNGAISWNGVKVSEAKLASYLAQAAALHPVPVTQIKFEPGVDCDTVARLRRLMSKTLDCNFGPCAEGSGRWWQIGDVGPPFTTYDPHPGLPQDE
jgi:hypothetical protein